MASHRTIDFVILIYTVSNKDFHIHIYWCYRKRRSLVSRRKVWANTEFKVKASLFSREWEKKGKATPQTEWLSLITSGRETSSIFWAGAYMCFLFPWKSSWYGELLQGTRRMGASLPLTFVRYSGNGHNGIFCLIAFVLCVCSVWLMSARVWVWQYTGSRFGIQPPSSLFCKNSPHAHFLYYWKF